MGIRINTGCLVICCDKQDVPKQVQPAGYPETVRKGEQNTFYGTK